MYLVTSYIILCGGILNFYWQCFQISALSVIHITGTKGKGSTSAMVESILRSSGHSTGLYTSPHLVTVRERIRINGKPLAEDKFVKYFNYVHDRLVVCEILANFC